MLKETPVKIVAAAEELGLSYKTLYNWISDGKLPLVHPGFVFMSDVRRAWIKTQNSKAEQSKETSSLAIRDHNGRFTKAPNR